MPIQETIFLLLVVRLLTIKSENKGVNSMTVNSIGAVGTQPQAVQQSEPVQVQPTLKPMKEVEYQPIEKKSFEPVEIAKGTRAISEEAVEKNLRNLNELLRARQTNITMEYDNLSSPKTVNIVDANSGDIIRKMPPEGVVEIAMKARDYVIGLMIDKTV